jgi:hypothetical protein
VPVAVRNPAVRVSRLTIGAGLSRT